MARENNVVMVSVGDHDGGDDDVLAIQIM